MAQRSWTKVSPLLGPFGIAIVTFGYKTLPPPVNWVALGVGVVIIVVAAIGYILGPSHPESADKTAFASGKFNNSVFEDNESDGTDTFITGKATNSTFRRNRQRRNISPADGQSESGDERGA